MSLLQLVLYICKLSLLLTSRTCLLDNFWHKQFDCFPSLCLIIFFGPENPHTWFFKCFYWRLQLFLFFKPFKFKKSYDFSTKQRRWIAQVFKFSRFYIHYINMYLNPVARADWTRKIILFSIQSEKRIFEIPTSRYFKLRQNTAALSQVNCINFLST